MNLLWGADVFDAPFPPLGFNMLSPPSLPQNPASFGNDVTVIDETPVKGQAKKGGKAAGVEGLVGMDVAPGAPKRCGRPPGSKNKPKNI
jgi:hypothetical protein